ncbi:MAG: molybdenum cofactor guanylyltransferase [Omnitrophica WOR_2 bacterium]
MLSVVIQAGGESRRMGQDKAFIPFLGEPLIQRLIRRLTPIADSLLVITNQPDRYQMLNLPLTPDILPGRGALGGLYTALSAASEPAVAVVACDMPFINPGLLAAERDLLFKNQVDAVIPRLEQGIEPFHAVYRRDTCLPAIKTAIDTGKWRVDSWFPQITIHYLSHEDILPFDPYQLAFINLNTPEELQQAEKRARESMQSES